MYAKRAAAVTLLSFALGCGGSPDPITVSGKVWPVPTTPVTMVLGSQTTTTDAATGAFAFATKVRPPYDLALRAGDFALVYQGLTRPDPTVSGFYHTMIGMPVTFVSGVITGPVLLNITDYMAMSAWGSPEASDYGMATVVAQLQFHQGVSWLAPPASSTGNLHALQWKRISQTDPNPESYVAYGKRTGVTVTQGSDLSGQDIATTGPISTVHLQGSAAAPAGYTLQMLDAYLAFSDGAQMYLFGSTSPGTFDIAMPSVPDATATLSVSARKGTLDEWSYATRTGVRLDASGAAVSLRAAPELTAPDDAATGVTGGTAFSWKPFPNGVHVVRFLGGQPGAPSVFVITARSSVTIPDLAALGLTLPASAPYQWEVQGLAPFASVDAIADLTAIRNRYQVAAETFNAWSPSRAFTTAASP